MVFQIAAGLLLAQGLPTTLAQEEPARPGQEEERPQEFAINVNLWPLLESHTLPDGNRRTSLWPLFHVTTMPQGGVHSWHVLNLLWGPNYHMVLPLYYSVDEHLGILPPLLLAGPDYLVAPPLLSGQWRHADGDLTTWVTPLFHLTNTPDGDVRSLHVGPYLQGPDYWAIPPLLTGSWASEGGRTAWVTPLFHETTGADGRLRSLHVGPYFQGEDYWAVPPALTWHRRYDSGESATWITPLFHRTSDQDGDFVSTHVGPYFQGKDYWFLLPLAGSGTFDDGSRTTWITPLFHLTRDKDGNVRDYHVGPYVETADRWWIPPLLTTGWHRPDGMEMTVGLFFWLRTDQEGLASNSLCPVYWWERNSHWFVLPLLSGQWGSGQFGRLTWLTPLFHVDTDAKGEVESFHVGPYFEGKDYWALPPLLSWHTREGDESSTWLTPLFHRRADKEGAESSHLFPVYFWKRDDYWVAPPLLSMGWTDRQGDRTTWVTPFFHWTADSDGLLLDMHVGPFMKGRDFWGIPPLLTGGWHHAGGGDTTWITPLFHSTTDARGDLESLHVGPYLQGTNYWALPPLLSWHVRYADESETTWLTPVFHVSADARGWSSAHLFPAFFYRRHPDGARTTWVTPLFHSTVAAGGDLHSLHVAPVWFWEREKYWFIPPLLTGGGTHDDGAQTTWISPLFHVTEDKAGGLESLHTFPVFFWKRDEYWAAPLLVSGGFTRPDGSTRTWISPLYHEDHAADGSLLSRHALNYFEGPNYRHVVPVFWDWTRKDDVRHTMFAPPLFVRTEDPSGDVTASLPWPIVTWRSGRELDTSLGMELRPFVYQEAGDQLEFNFLWRLFSVRKEEESTRVMVGPLWFSERPNQPDAMTKFQILGGLFARDCNYDTERYRYRILWFIPLGANDMY